MRRLFVALAAAIMLPAAGCRTVLPRPAVDAPDWVRAAEADAQPGPDLSATGIAGPGPDAEAVMEQAELAARRRLVQVAAAYVRQAITGFLNAHHEYPSADSAVTRQFTEALLAEVTAALLRSEQRQQSWQAPDGRIYVLYRVPVAAVNEEIATRSSMVLGQANPFGAAAERATEQLRDFLSSLIEQRLAAADRVAEPAAEERGPTWPSTGRHARYPPDEYLTAVGLGADLTTAEQAALGELAARVGAAVANLVRTLGSPEAEGPLAENIRWLDPAALRYAPNELPAARIAERWHDPVTDTHYTLAVLDRATAALFCRSEIAGARERSAGLSASAANQQRAGNYAASLQDHLDAVAAARRAVRLQLAALATVPEPSKAEFRAILSEPALGMAKEGLASLLSLLTMEKAGGDSQWMPPDVAPKEPLEARLTAGDDAAPVAGVPLQLRAGSAAGQLMGRAVTSADGSAQWLLRRPPPADVPRPVLVAELDLAGLSPQTDLYRMPRPHVEFGYVLRSRVNSHLVVYVNERIADGRLLPTPLAEELREAIRAEGLMLADDPDAAARMAAGGMGVQTPVPEVLQAFSGLRKSLGAGRFLLIVLGEIRLTLEEKTETPEGELYIVYCPYDIKVLDGALPGEDKTVLAVTGTGKGAYLGNELEAARRARAEAAAEAAAQLLSGLRGKLGTRTPG